MARKKLSLGNRDKMGVDALLLKLASETAENEYDEYKDKYDEYKNKIESMISMGEVIEADKNKAYVNRINSYVNYQKKCSQMAFNINPSVFARSRSKQKGVGYAYFLKDSERMVLLGNIESGCTYSDCAGVPVSAGDSVRLKVVKVGEEHVICMLCHFEEPVKKYKFNNPKKVWVSIEHIELAPAIVPKLKKA